MNQLTAQSGTYTASREVGLLVLMCFGLLVELHDFADDQVFRI